jgi:hypothetical protein
VATETEPAPLVTEYLTVLLQAWTMALEPHLDELLDITRPSSPPSPRERSHAIATVVLSAFAIESNAARLKVIRDWDPPSTSRGGPRDALLAFLRDGLPGFPRSRLIDVGEVLLLRNALAHNHVWRMRETPFAERYSVEAIEPLLRRNDWLLSRHASADRRHTRRHRLNLVPDLVGYNDARKVLSILIATLDTLARLDVPNMLSAADATKFRLEGHSTLRSFGRMPSRRVHA